MADDTREEAPARRTVFHTAAIDPTSPADAHPRYTIEVRMQAVYHKEADKAQRVERWLGHVAAARYPDGTESTWWSGPIDGHIPPAHVPERLAVVAAAARL